MSSHWETTDVLIVGGGPSGLVSALLLARLGVSSVVVERNPKTDDHPKAHELNTRTIEILREIGIVEEELAKEASPIADASRIQFCRTINEELGYIDLLEDPARRKKYEVHLQQTLPYLNLSQSEFERILVRHAEASDEIELRFGHAWQSYEETQQGIASTVTGGEGAYKVASRYLLGCDGASSRVRKACGIEMQGPANIQSFVNAYFEADLSENIDTRAKLYWILHPEYAGTFVAHHVEKRWVYAVPINAPWESPEDFTEEILLERIFGALGQKIPGLAIKSISTWHMTAQIAQRYRKGNVLLVGDAAHRFPPTGGLGMNTGIADAHNLCWKLARIIQRKSDESLLHTYEIERRPIAQHNCQESLENFHKIFEVIDALGLSEGGLRQFTWLMKGSPIRLLPNSIRNVIRWAATRVPVALVGRALKPGTVRDRVRAAIGNQVNHFDRLGLDIGYRYGEGALIGDELPVPQLENPVADYVPTTKAGARLPHCWVNNGEARESSHAKIGYDHFTLFGPRSEGETQEPLCSEGVVMVDSSLYPDNTIPHDRAILVRPDGHVAWNGTLDAFLQGDAEKALDVVAHVKSRTESKVHLQGNNQ